MVRNFKKPILATTMAVMAVAMVWGGQTTFAQGGVPGSLSADAQAFNACTTTSYADVAAKALGITAAELRKDIVNGQTLQDIAKSKNVDVQTVIAAIQTASKADIAQAVKDGVLTQAEATAMESGGAGPAGTPPAAGAAPQGGAQGGQQGNGGAPGSPQGSGGAPGGPQGNGGAPGSPQGSGGAPGGPQGNQQGGSQTQLPDISNLRILLQLATPTTSAPSQGPRGSGGQDFGGFGGTESFNVVKPYAVAAQALNLKCINLVKTLVTTSGKSIVAVAADQKIDAKTVTDALTKAYKDALAQDVTDGIITQAQFDQIIGNLDKGVSDFINSTSAMRPGPMPSQAK
jgi:hypothetical protein